MYYNLFILAVLLICRKVNNQGYYLINPDKTLSNAEKRILSFLKERKVDWPGITSVEPTSDQFSSLLQENDILLYVFCLFFVLPSSWF